MRLCPFPPPLLTHAPPPLHAPPQDFLVRLLEEKKLDQLKAYKMLLTLFKTLELIQWSSFQELYRTELLAHSAFGGDKQTARWCVCVVCVCVCV